MTAIRGRVLLSTVYLIVVSAAPMLPQERGAPRPANGNNLIRPLADLEKDLKGKLEKIKVHGKSLEGNLVMLEQYASSLKQMKAIRMNVGTQDGLLQTNRDMDQPLTRAGIPHTFETFEGDHNGQVGLNFETKVLPFFSQQLSFGERSEGVS